MEFYLGVTDTDWYRFLRLNKTEDVNFWQPGGSRQFSAIPKGAPFLFKLKSPLNVIGGLGFSSDSGYLPVTPRSRVEMPDPSLLQWHNENVYMAG